MRWSTKFLLWKKVVSQHVAAPHTFIHQIWNTHKKTQPVGYNGPNRFSLRGSNRLLLVEKTPRTLTAPVRGIFLHPDGNSVHVGSNPDLWHAPGVLRLTKYTYYNAIQRKHIVVLIFLHTYMKFIFSVDGCRSMAAEPAAKTCRHASTPTSSRCPTAAWSQQRWPSLKWPLPQLTKIPSSAL